jgi:NADH-quinone oxidoreductase subunit B
MGPVPVVIGRDPAEVAEPVRVRSPDGFDLVVFDLGLACCAVEFAAATMDRDGFARLDAAVVAEPRRADVIVVSGTVTDKMATAVRRIYDELPAPKYVVSFGSCANCGGPYWDSYCVTKGVDQILPVDVYVPGCPPRPEALLHGLQMLRDRIDSGVPALDG